MQHEEHLIAQCFMKAMFTDWTKNFKVVLTSTPEIASGRVAATGYGQWFWRVVTDHTGDLESWHG